jgi:adenosylcobinamide-GDP ribazoletransferase
MQALASLRIAIGFLTRFPVGSAPHDAADFGRALGWFPVVGAGIGASLLAAAWLLHGILPASLVAVCTVAAWAWLSGGLHLDGFCDLVDGLSGGRGDRERTLAVMRDSHIGAHGASALCLLLIGKTAALLELLAIGGAGLLIACASMARFAAVMLILLFPYARGQGLGSAFHRDARHLHLLLGALALGLVLIGSGGASVIPAASGLSAALLLGYWLRRRLGGLTGDVYGAAIELAELVFLMAACLRSP